MPKLHSLLLVLALLLAACLTEPRPTVTLRIEGTVTDAVTGLPIEGTRIALYWGFEDAPPTFTNAEGRYTLSRRKENCTEYNTLSANGFAQGYQVRFELGRDRYRGIPCTEDTQRFDFRLTPR